MDYFYQERKNKHPIFGFDPISSKRKNFSEQQCKRNTDLWKPNTLYLHLYAIFISYPSSLPSSEKQNLYLRATMQWETVSVDRIWVSKEDCITSMMQRSSFGVLFCFVINDIVRQRLRTSSKRLSYHLLTLVLRADCSGLNSHEPKKNRTFFSLWKS